MRSARHSIVSDLSVLATGAVFLLGLIALAVRLKAMQLDGAAEWGSLGLDQSVRRVLTSGERGRILDRNGQVLADNRTEFAIEILPQCFQGRSYAATVAKMAEAVTNVAQIIGKDVPERLENDLFRHVNRETGMPYTIWNDIDEIAIARFSEHERELPGFICSERAVRFYPERTLAAHVIGYAKKDYNAIADAGGDYRFEDHRELEGKDGLEAFYDDYLRGVPGEKRLIVNSLGFTEREQTVAEAQRGLDLTLSIDSGIQRVAEQQLEGVRGACVVMDPRNGEILAMASSPTYDLNDCAPRMSPETWRKLSSPPDLPGLNRAVWAKGYAPGSTFKPITALAGLRMGYPEDQEYDCTGTFPIANIHCSSRWGHGSLNVCDAIKQSCNTFFCNLGLDIGTNAIIQAAKDFGLGSGTGIDLPVISSRAGEFWQYRSSDFPGNLPSAEYVLKTSNPRRGWATGDLLRMSFGQGDLLVTPLQMARVAGAIGTGYLVKPHLRKDVETVKEPLPFARPHLDIVREGMRRVVDGGTGRRGGADVAVPVAGKTGTAEIGSRRYGNLRNNTWFIAYAPVEDPTVAIALIVENGASGGATAAPKVCEILKGIFNKND